MDLLLQDLEIQIETLQQKIAAKNDKSKVTLSDSLDQKELKETEQLLKEKWQNLTPADRVYIARKKERPKIREYIEVLFTDFFEQRGDRFYSDDPSIVGGIALYKGLPVTVVGTNKGTTLEENIACRFGMPQPDGYRKALRIMKQAEKFGRPIITFVDTPGAYPGLEAEERGQGLAIASSLAEMSQLRVPILTIITGEGGSGGALALSVSNYWIMLENSVYSILSPEGFATILWKDSSRSKEASSLMKLTAEDLFEYSIVDAVISEDEGGASKNRDFVMEQVDVQIEKYLRTMSSWSDEKLLLHRKEKFRTIGVF